MHDKVAVSQRAGTAALWSANHLFERDPGALSALALAGNTTLRVTLMAVNPYIVHPMQAAMAAARRPGTDRRPSFTPCIAFGRNRHEI